MPVSRRKRELKRYRRLDNVPREMCDPAHDWADTLEELDELLPKHRRVKRLSFYLTCAGSPEQYDVHASVRRDTPPVGYVRLRHCRFTADVLGPRGQLDDDTVEVMREYLPGDNIGWFDSEAQRVGYLARAADAITAELARQGRASLLAMPFSSAGAMVRPSGMRYSMPPPGSSTPLRVTLATAAV